MKKLFASVLAGLLSLTVLTPFASAALTEEQQKTLIAYTEAFLEEGNKRGILQYGTVDNHLGHNLFTRDLTSKGNLQIPSSANVTFPGTYLVLDCSAFFQVMYKAVFGLRLDYLYSGMYTGGHHASNWSTPFYFDAYDKLMAGNEDVMKVYDLNGDVVDLFETVIYLKGTPSGKYHTRDLVSYLDQMEVGDPIIGYNTDSGLGHFMFYGGDGYLYHSTSNHQTIDGQVVPYAMRKQKVADCTDAFTDLKVLRLADNILEPDFEGYNVLPDFDKISSTDSIFDTTAPYFETVDITKSGSTFTVKVKASDEHGGLQPLTFYHQPDVVYKSSGYGESGLLGITLSDSAQVPALYMGDYRKDGYTPYAFIGNKHETRTFTRLQTGEQERNAIGKIHYGYLNGTALYFQVKNANDIGSLLTSGTYYLHAKDCAENTASPIRLLLTDKVSYAFDESGALLTRYVMNYKTHPLSVSDITADGKIDLFDAMKALEHISGTKRLLSDAAVDANGDGVANVLDVITILKNEGKKPELAAASKPMTVAGYVE